MAKINKFVTYFLQVHILLFLNLNILFNHIRKCYKINKLFDGDGRSFVQLVVELWRLYMWKFQSPMMKAINILISFECGQIALKIHSQLDSWATYLVVQIIQTHPKWIIPCWLWKINVLFNKLRSIISWIENSLNCWLNFIVFKIKIIHLIIYQFILI